MRGSFVWRPRSALAIVPTPRLLLSNSLLPARRDLGFEDKIRSAPGSPVAYRALGMPLIVASTLAEDGSSPQEPDQAKAFVMAELARIVQEGGASMTALAAGTFELRLATGEVFYLQDNAITRIA